MLSECLMPPGVPPTYLLYPRYPPCELDFSMNIMMLSASHPPLCTMSQSQFKLAEDLQSEYVSAREPA